MTSSQTGPISSDGVQSEWTPFAFRTAALKCNSPFFMFGYDAEKAIASVVNISLKESA